MSIQRKILILTLFQGLVCQRWEFPTRMDGLIGSCVEIPCTFHPKRNSGPSNTVWYLYQSRGYPQIFNSQRSSSVLENYRGRTSQVPGRSQCSLRIDPVRRDDGGKFYYPGIAEDQGANAWSRQNQKTLALHVTDTPSIPKLSGNGEMLEGRPEKVSCSVEHTCGSNPPSLKWNKPGPTERQSVDLSGGKWREILTIIYNSSHEDDGTQIQCTATYHNGETSQNATTLNIRYAARGVQVVVLHPTEGATELKCTFNRSSPNVTHYTWMKDGNILLNKTGQILVLDSNEDKFGSYSCIAHNTAGNSTPAELEYKDSTADADSSNIPLILGVLAGVILLLFLVMMVFFCTRQKRKPAAPLSPIHGEIPSHFRNIRDQDETLVQEHQYGNIQINPKVPPRTLRSPYSSHVSGEQSYAIYSNAEFIHSETDIEYSTIAHSHHGRRQDLTDGYGDSVNYAAMKH